MASADVTCAASGFEFTVDSSQHKATLLHPGGWVRNTGGTNDAVINTDAGTATQTQPSGTGCIRLGPGKSCQLPPECLAFTFASASGSFLQYSAYALT